MVKSCQHVKRSAKPLLLHVTTVPSTLYTFFAGQVDYMKKKSFEVAAASSPGPDIELVEQRDNIKIYQVAMKRCISPLSDVVAIFKLFKLMRKLRPTIVHGHTPKGGLLGMIAAYLARVPVRVFTLHGLRSSGVSGFRKRIIDNCEKLTCHLAQKVFAVSHSVLREALTAGYCDEQNITVLANGSCNGIDAKNLFNKGCYPSDLGTQIRKKYGIPEKALVLCYVGRIVTDKGIAELIQAWEKLRSEFKPLYLVLIGDFEPEDTVGQKVIELQNKDDHVKAIGFVYNMPEHYLIADMIILPSYREGFPYSPLEAAAMELPVIATRVSGCVDAVEDGKTGILVPPKDVEALYLAIKKILSNETIRIQLGQAGRKRVLEYFEPEKVWEAIHDQYLNLINRFV